MKKFIFAVATALVMTVSLVSCGADSSKVDAALDEYEEIVVKLEEASKTLDLDKVSEAVDAAMKWAEKYEDISESDLSSAQKERFENLKKRADSVGQ